MSWLERVCRDSPIETESIGSGDAITYGMGRMRISTTVDGERLATVRRLLPVSDSQILDRALIALIERLEAEQELAALGALPYEDDPDLAWPEFDGPDLPYDGAVPPEVVRLAAKRRRRS